MCILPLRWDIQCCNKVYRYTVEIGYTRLHNFYKLTVWKKILHKNFSIYVAMILHSQDLNLWTKVEFICLSLSVSLSFSHSYCFEKSFIIYTQNNAKPYCSSLNMSMPEAILKKDILRNDDRLKRTWYWMVLNMRSTIP